MSSPVFVSLINLFFVPLIPVFFYYKKKDQPLARRLELLFHYGMAAVFLIPVTKVIAFLPGIILHKHIDLDSGYYTIAALIAVWLLPFLSDIAQHVSIKVEFVKDEVSSDEKTSE